MLKCGGIELESKVGSLIFRVFCIEIGMSTPMRLIELSINGN